MTAAARPSGFRSHVTWLAGGAAASQGIQMLAAPLLARLYSPDAFGGWALFLGLGGIAAAFGGMRYELAIVPAADEDEAWRATAVQTICSVAVTLVTLLFLGFGSRHLLALLDAPGLEGWIWWIPLFVLFTSVGNAAIYWLVRSERFRHLSILRFLQGLATVSVQGWLSAWISGPGGLIAGSLAGCTALAMGFTGLRSRATAWWNRSRGGLAALRKTAWKHRNFPRYMVAYGIAGALRDRGLLLIMAGFSTAAEVGFFSLAVRVVYMPVGLITTSFSSVIYQRIAVMPVRQDAAPFIESLLKKIITCGVPVFAALVWFAPGLFELVFGPEWERAGFYAAIMAAPGFTLLVSGLFDRLLDIVGKQKTVMVMEVTYSIAALLAIAIGLGYYDNITVALVTFAILTVTYHVVWVCAVYIFFEFPMGGLVRLGLRAVLLAAASTAVAGLIQVSIIR